MTSSILQIIHEGQSLAEAWCLVEELTHQDATMLIDVIKRKADLEIYEIFQESYVRRRLQLKTIADSYEIRNICGQPLVVTEDLINVLKSMEG